MVYTLPMQLLFIHAAGLLYIVCSLLPEQQRRFITFGTGLGWLLHGVALASIVITPDYLRLGFAVMLSAALWMTVAAYWIENRNLSVDGLRRLVLPIAAIVIVLPAFFPGSEILLRDPLLLQPKKRHSLSILIRWFEINKIKTIEGTPVFTI